MHYFDFKYPPDEDNKCYYKTNMENGKHIPFPRINKESLSKLSGWIEFVDQLRWSCNNEGAPAEISNEALNTLFIQLDE